MNREDKRKASKQDLINMVEFLQEREITLVEEKEAAINGWLKTKEKLKHLFAGKHPDICEFYKDCDIAGGNCVEPENTLRVHCNVYKQYLAAGDEGRSLIGL